jgi:hypothetical protein
LAAVWFWSATKYPSMDQKKEKECRKKKNIKIKNYAGSESHSPHN